MRHVPHLYLPGPWPAGSIELDPQQVHHLSRVLRLDPGVPVTYTDGVGRVGAGTLAAGSIERGEERLVEAPTPPIEVAVAPPRSVGRQRFLVEKLAELGVDRLVWIMTARTEGRPPRPEKARAWAVAALEQSGGAWLLDLAPPMALADLAAIGATLWVAERETQIPPSVVKGGMLVIGPEGGLDKGEVPTQATPFGLGKRVLRVETAAVVAAALFLERSGRLA